MFERKKRILFITRSKVRVIIVTLKSKPDARIIQELDWTTPTLDETFLKIKKNIKKNVDILLGEDFVYVVNISYPQGSVITRDIVQKKAQELIPENLDETVWDFRQTSTIQVVAVVKSFLETISKSAANADITVNSIEPLSYSLARFTKKVSFPILFVYINDDVLLVLAQKEVVLATERLTNVNPNSINQFIDFAKEKIGADIKNVVFCGNTKNLDLSTMQIPNLKLEVQDINPAISLAYRENLKGKDKDSLILRLLKIVDAKSQNNKKSKKNYLIVIFFAGLITSLLTIVLFSFWGIPTQLAQDVT